MYRIVIKRVIDILASIFIIILIFPILLIVAILVKLDSRGEVIFKHKRIGINGKAIYVYKFRTMVPNAMKIGPESTSIGDSRITKIGKKLRKYSIDELPQLLNILKGDMSLIGPRPMAYKKTLMEKERIKLKVRPGLTGLAQVMGRSSLKPEAKIGYEIEYVNDYNLIMDLKIIVKTIKIVIFKDGAY